MINKKIIPKSKQPCKLWRGKLFVCNNIKESYIPLLTSQLEALTSTSHDTHAHIILYYACDKLQGDGLDGKGNKVSSLIVNKINGSKYSVQLSGKFMWFQTDWQYRARLIWFLKRPTTLNYIVNPVK